MSENLGLVFNRSTLIGRVVGQPVIQNGWATLTLRTQVPMPSNGTWTTRDCMVPCLTDNPKTVETIQKFVEDQRQLLIEGFVDSWEGGFGVIITNIKLGSKTIYDPNSQGNQNSGMPF